MEEIDIAKYNISRLTHTKPGGFNEKVVLKSLGMSSLPRAVAVRVLLEILNVKIMIEKRKGNEKYDKI